MALHSIIIGAGIAGLVTASHLQQAGRTILLLENSKHAGGVIKSLDADGFLIERGPNSLRGTHEFLDLLEELGLQDELVTGDATAPAYVYVDGALHAVPMSPPALIKTKLLSIGAKFRLLGEPFIKARREAGEESVASFIERRLGRQVLERLVSPFVSGVYAGDVEQLSVQASFAKLPEFEIAGGSILRGALRAMRAGRNGQATPKRSLRPYRLCSFRRGLEALPGRLAKSLGENFLREAQVTSIRDNNEANSSARFEVVFEHQGTRHTVAAATLIVATPADAAALLLKECAPEIASLIADIPYASLASVPLAYRQEQLARPLDGFGFLAPRSAGLRTLGSVWNSSLFPERAPAGWVCLTNYIGGATDREAITLSDDELIATVHQDLHKVLGLTGEPRRLPITRHQRALPQYILGHAARITAVEAALQNRTGLFLSGNYLRGISLGDSIKQAMQVAEKSCRC
ncbi:MAG: protoporphyrinogen oxidase [Acidobacteria bacterium]|nr:protoporphyrinogen oxidase [Acidobacteriota bacterium]